MKEIRLASAGQGRTWCWNKTLRTLQLPRYLIALSDERITLRKLVAKCISKKDTVAATIPFSSVIHQSSNYWQINLAGFAYDNGSSDSRCLSSRNIISLRKQSWGQNDNDMNGLSSK